MPVKRTLNLGDKENTTPAKRRAQNKNFSPITGTCSISVTDSPQVGRKTHSPSKTQTPQTDTEKLHALRCKIKASVIAFKQARARIEKTLFTEGSSELSCFFRRGSTDLLDELRKNGELGAMVESCLAESDSGLYCIEGPERPRSSYEFLKSILN